MDSDRRAAAATVAGNGIIMPVNGEAVCRIGFADDQGRIIARGRFALDGEFDRHAEVIAGDRAAAHTVHDGQCAAALNGQQIVVGRGKDVGPVGDGVTVQVQGVAAGNIQYIIIGQRDVRQQCHRVAISSRIYRLLQRRILGGLVAVGHRCDRRYDLVPGDAVYVDRHSRVVSSNIESVQVIMVIVRKQSTGDYCFTY